MSEPTDQTAPAAPSRAATAFLGAATGVAVTLLLIVAIVVTLQSPARRWLLGDFSTRLDRLEQQQADVVSRLDRLAAAPPAPHGDDPAAGDIADRLTMLEGDINSLRRAIPPEGVILRLSERTEAAERTVHDIAQRQASNQALLLTLGQLREAVDRGDPFAVELSTAKQLLPNDEVALLDGFANGAEGGIKRHDQLLQDFQPLVSRLLQQEEDARGTGLGPMIARHLHKLISIRRVDGKGNDAEAVLGRTEAALAKDDWDQALVEMRALPGPFGETAAIWVQQAELRQSADRALSKVTALAALQTAGPDAK